MSALFRDKVTIQRASVAYSDTREATRTFGAIATNVPASIQPRSGSYRRREYGQPNASDFAGFVATTVDVRIGDRVVRGTDTFEVLFVAPEPTHLELDLGRVVAP